MKQMHFFSAARKDWEVSDLIQSVTTLFKSNGQEHLLIPRAIYIWIESPLEDRGAKVMRRLGCHITIQPSPASHGFPLMTPILLWGSVAGEGRPSAVCVTYVSAAGRLPTLTLSPLALAHAPPFLSAVRQGVRLQRPTHVRQGGQTDGLHPLQLHEGDPVQPAQPRRLPRWVEQPPSRFPKKKSKKKKKIGKCVISFPFYGWCYELADFNWAVTSSDFLLSCIFFHFFFSGCPFRHSDPELLKQKLQVYKVAPSGISQVGAARPPLHRFSAVSHKPGFLSPEWWRKTTSGKSRQNSSAGLSGGWKRSLSGVEASVAGFLQRLEYGALGWRRVGSQGELNFYCLAISVLDNSCGKRF